MFFNVLPGSDGIRIHFKNWIRVRIRLKSCILIRIKSMRIRNTAGNYTILFSIGRYHNGIESSKNDGRKLTLRLTKGEKIM
jgi:hypothetical protein